MAVGDASGLSAERSPTTARAVVLQLLLSAAFVYVALAGTYFLSWAGSRSARQFLLDGGSADDGAQLGAVFGLLTGVLIVVAGMLCLARVDADRYAIPGWVGQIVVVILGLFATVLLFLLGIGGMGGPPTDQSDRAQFARALYGWLPMIPVIGVIAVVEIALVWRSTALHRRVPRWRLTLACGLLVVVTVFVLVAVAWSQKND